MGINLLMKPISIIVVVLYSVGIYSICKVGIVSSIHYIVFCIIICEYCTGVVLGAWNYIFKNIITWNLL